MKNEKTKLIIWAVIALVIGVVIGMLITNATTGNAKLSIVEKEKSPNLGDDTLQKGIGLMVDQNFIDEIASRCYSIGCVPNNRLGCDCQDMVT